MTKRKIVQVETPSFPEDVALHPACLCNVWGIGTGSFDFGIDTGVVLFMNGVGTLLLFDYQRQSFAYLGSSFAFIAPVSTVMAVSGVETLRGSSVCWHHRYDCCFCHL